LVSYGRFRLAGDGDSFRTADLVDHHWDARDNSFVRVSEIHSIYIIHILIIVNGYQYELLPDANISIQDALDVPVRRVYYGQLLNIYYVEFITDLE
jgi:hypothetical protein